MSQSLNLEQARRFNTVVLTKKEIDSLDPVMISPGVFSGICLRCLPDTPTVVGRKIFIGRIDSKTGD